MARRGEGRKRRETQFKIFQRDYSSVLLSLAKLHFLRLLESSKIKAASDY